VEVLRWGREHWVQTSQDIPPGLFGSAWSLATARLHLETYVLVRDVVSRRFASQILKAHSIARHKRDFPLKALLLAAQSLDKQIMSNVHVDGDGTVEDFEDELACTVSAVDAPPPQYFAFLRIPLAATRAYVVRSPPIL
jgi:hypothetical protein